MRTGSLKDRVEFVPTAGNPEESFVSFADVTLIRPQNQDVEESYGRAQTARWEIILRNSFDNQILLNDPIKWRGVLLRRGGLSVNLQSGSITDDRQFLVLSATGGVITRNVLITEGGDILLSENDLELLV